MPDTGSASSRASPRSLMASPCQATSTEQRSPSRDAARSKSTTPVAVATRRGEVVLPARLVTSIRPDTVFIPYHWPGALSANLLTARHLDPVSRIPEFKVSACRLAKVGADRYSPELLELQRMAREASSLQGSIPDQVL